MSECFSGLGSVVTSRVVIEGNIMNVFIALVNPKSGGNIGNQLLQRFREIQKDDPVVEVYNLSEEGGPRKALEDHRDTKNLRIIACGGDGTVGWILSVMDAMDIPPAERPAIGIIPLGTGNDLARSLSWGGKYRDKPLKKVLMDIANADIIDLDRWSLSYCPLDNHGDTPEEIANADVKLPLDVLNNYFSVGIDAHIALQFHRARNSNPEHFTSRTRNLLFYGLEGGKDLFKHQWRNLMDHVTIECDGFDYTPRLKAYGTHSVMFLNIRSYAGGTKPWNRKNGAQCMNDGLLEVVAIDNLDLAILHAGGSGASVCQCKRAVITTNSCVPMQIDGEPCLMKPCRIVIEHRNRSKVLVRNKTATYAVKDDEIEDWAAKKIQSSFKLYKHQKNQSQKSASENQKVNQETIS